MDEPLDPEHALGAAIMLCYLRDLIMLPGGRDHWTREELLVLLEIVSTDPEIFPDAIGIQMWNLPD